MTSSTILLALAVLVVVQMGCQSSDRGGGKAESDAPMGPDPVTGESADRSWDSVARRSMVRDQIEGRGVEDVSVLAAMRKVPRHRFVPESWQSSAYDDGPLPIGHDQTISQPYIVAFMTAALRLTGDERVLEIGTGSGYQAAVLSELSREVFTIEIVAPLARRAEAVLSELGYSNVQVRAGDGYRGWPEQAPFDAIVVTAAPDHVPQPLVDQLKVGGRMIIPLGEATQELIVIEKTAEGATRRKVLPVRFVPMTGEAERDEPRSPK